MPVYFHGDIAKAAPNITQEQLRAMLDRRAPQVVRFLVRLWGRQTRDITYRELRQAILTGDISPETMQRWREDYSLLVTRELMPEWREIIAGAVTGFRRRWPAFAFDPGVQAVADYTARHAAQLVTNCTAQQIDAIRAIVQRAATVQDMTVDELARVIRPTIGLYRGQATANFNHYVTVRDTLLQDFPTMGRQTAERRARDAAVRYAARQHRYRAQMIARTELAFAHNTGEFFGVRQAQSEGYMGAVEKQVVTAGEDRVCALCRELDGQRFPMDAQIMPGVIAPPFHPHCRCVMNYIEI